MSRAGGSFFQHFGKRIVGRTPGEADEGVVLRENTTDARPARSGLHHRRAWGGDLR